MPLQEFIPVTIDKSHITTIGERLYAESIEFIRELVNNSYDADATSVDVLVSEDSIEIKDNGTGMNREGLKQYFNIGSQQKLNCLKSPIHKRDLIGQFGIGKFASLAACKKFEVLTKKDDFAARVTFDKDLWDNGLGSWELPLEILSPDSRKGNGTTVVLRGLEKKFDPKDIEAKIIEGTPIKAPNFKMRINGHIIIPRSLSGHRIPLLEGTSFGPVTGEIIILPELAALKSEPGIEVKVKQVTIKRELFGLETLPKAVARVRGEVNADFLPITSDRTGFIKDSDEFVEFLALMSRVMDNVRVYFQKLTQRRESYRVSRALKEALKRIYKSLAVNPDLSPFGALPLGDEERRAGEAAHLTKANERTKQGEDIKTEDKSIEAKKKKNT